MKKSTIAKCISIVFVVFCLVFGHYEIHSQENNNDSQTKQTQTNENISVTQTKTPPIQTDTQKAHPVETENTSQEQKEKAKDIRDWFAVVLNSLLFIAVLVQAYIYHRQLSVMKDQASVMNKTLDHSRESFAISERAYIGIKQLTLDAPIAVGEYPKVTAVFLNGGKTPAWNFVTVFRLILHNETSSDVEKTFPVENLLIANDRGSFLPSGAEKIVDFKQVEIVITANDFQLIKAGTLKMYIFGKAVYKDFQGKEQVFPFYQTYDPTNNHIYECLD